MQVCASELQLGVTIWSRIAQRDALEHALTEVHVAAYLAALGTLHLVAGIMQVLSEPCLTSYSMLCCAALCCVPGPEEPHISRSCREVGWQCAQPQTCMLRLIHVHFMAGSMSVLPGCPHSQQSALHCAVWLVCCVWLYWLSARCRPDILVLCCTCTCCSCAELYRCKV